MDKSKEQHEDVFEVIQEWWQEGVPFFPKGSKFFLTHNMKEPYRLVVAMISRLYREENNIHFRRERTPMAHYVAKDTIFNWA